MRNLGVVKVFLWPRFHTLVVESLERNPPKVEEMVQKLSGPTKEVRPIFFVFPPPPHPRKVRKTAGNSADGSNLPSPRMVMYDE